MRKYSERFERDYKWYLDHLEDFCFDGQLDELLLGNSKAGLKAYIVPEKNGKTAKECWFLFDSHGKIVPCSEPDLLFRLHKAKGSINFNIKAWAQDRAKGYLPLLLFSQRLVKEKNKDYQIDQTIKDIETELQLLPWMVEAVEQQKKKYL